jgi:hypothetical protein
VGTDIQYVLMQAAYEAWDEVVEDGGVNRRGVGDHLAGRHLQHPQRPLVKPRGCGGGEPISAIPR